jgi:two-component system OmpR family sensor kinase
MRRAGKRPASIARRLGLWLGVGLTLLWLGASAIALHSLERELNAAYDDSLKQSALRILPLAVHSLREPWERQRMELDGRGASPALVTGADEDADEAGGSKEEPVEFDDESFSYVIRDRTGQIVMRDEDVPADFTIEAPAEGYGHFKGERIFTLADDRSGYSIVIIERSDRRAEAIQRSLMGLILPLLALLPLIAGTIWLALRVALKPLEKLRAELDARDGRNLAPLDANTQPRELRPLAETIGALLGRLRSALEAERHFAARSAHELRTPIAGALAQTQQLALELDGSPRLARVHEIETALRNLAGLSEKLLQLSRLEAGFARAETPTDILPVIRLMVRDLNGRDITEGRINLEIETESLVVPIDPDAFAIALRNLVENAARHGDAASEIDVLVGADGLRVENAGPVVPPEILAELGQPFVRGDTQAKGTGLGLSIVRSILEQTGGSLSFASPVPGKASGFSAAIRFQRASRQSLRPMAQASAQAVPIDQPASTSVG